MNTSLNIAVGVTGAQAAAMEMKRVELAASRMASAGRGVAGGSFIDRIGRAMGREGKAGREGAEILGFDAATGARMAGLAAVAYTMDRLASSTARAMKTMREEGKMLTEVIEDVVREVPMIGGVYSLIEEWRNGEERSRLQQETKRIEKRDKAIEDANKKYKKQLDDVRDIEHENATERMGSEQKAIADEEYAQAKRKEIRDRELEQRRGLGGFGMTQAQALAKREEAAEAVRLENIRRRARELPTLAMPGDAAWYQSPFARSALPPRAGGLDDGAGPTPAESRDARIMREGNEANTAAWRENAARQKKSNELLQKLVDQGANVKSVQSFGTPAVQ